MNSSSTSNYASTTELLTPGATQTTALQSSDEPIIVYVSSGAMGGFKSWELDLDQIIVGNEGLVYDAYMASEDILIIRSGGSASNVKSAEWGFIHVSSGGRLANVVMDDFYGAVIVSSGGYANNVIIDCIASGSNNGVSVLAGGFLENTFVLRGGGQGVEGYALHNYIQSSGSTQNIYSNGIAKDNHIMLGASCIINGSGTALDSVITDGSVMQINGGVASNTRVILANQFVYDVTASACKTVLSSGGFQDVKQGWTYDTIIESNGWQRVRYGEFIGGMFDGVVSGGGISYNTIIQGGVQTVEENGTAFDTLLIAGSQLVMSDGVASNTILRGGTLLVQSGGMLVNVTTYASTGGVTVAAGGVISGTYSANGGGLNLNSGAITQNFSVNINLNGASENTLLNVSNATALNALNWAITDNGHTAAGIYRITNIALNSLPVTLSGVQRTLTAATPYVVSSTNETVTYTLSSSASAGTVLNIYGTYSLLTGWAEGNNWRLATSNSKVTGAIYGTSTYTAVAGNVSLDINLNAENNTGNIYGLGANSSANGGVDMTLHGSGTYYGMIFGGSYVQYNNCTIGQNVNLSVSGISQLQNPAVTTGNTRWLMGGFYSMAGFSGTVNGNVNMSVTAGASVGHVMGGGYAVNSGSTVRVKGDVNMTFRNATIGGHVAAGGYTSTGGTSIVEGNVNILIDATESITFYGNIIAGGYNQGTNTVNQVLGTRTVTLTGLGSNINIPYGGINGGDNTPGGTRTVVFDDFTGSFAGGLYSLDHIKFVGDTVLTGLGNTFSSSNFVFDITDRSSTNYGTSMMDNVNAFNFKQNAGTVDVYLDEADFNSATSVALMDFDSSLNLNLNFNLYDIFGNAVALKTNNETHGFNISKTNGVIALTYV